MSLVCFDIVVGLFFLSLIVVFVFLCFVFELQRSDSTPGIRTVASPPMVACHPTSTIEYNHRFGPVGFHERTLPLVPGSGVKRGRKEEQGSRGGMQDRQGKPPALLFSLSKRKNRTQGWMFVRGQGLWGGVRRYKLNPTP